jgi:pyruvate dehydrogenase E1 component
MSSFIAAGTAYATHRIATIPFFIFYSMFGFQRIGDLIWAAGDARTRGFLIGGTSGRTTLAGEGLQHQDGNSHLLAYPVPTLHAFDPAFAYEIAVILRDGLRRMYIDYESIFYYLTVTNEPYPMPAMPNGAEEGILKGIYRLAPAEDQHSHLRAQLLGSGAIVREALQAQKILAENYGVAADVWSVTSYKELYQDGHACDRWNMLHPSEEPRLPYLTHCFRNAPGALVAASDYVRALPDSISRWMPRTLVSLGTDGYGRSDTRAALRDFFEIDARFITLATLNELARQKAVKPTVAEKAIRDLDINPAKPNPMIS